MGVLTDITAKANNSNAKRSSSSTSISIASNTQAQYSTKTDEDRTKAKSPRYMSPTLSSTQQTAAKASKAHDHDSTPSSSCNKTQGNNWMSSAAKRVGFRRSGDGTPRTDKAGISSRTMCFPDKLATTSYATIPNSPVSSPVQSVTTPLSEKPLPSPPVAQIVKTSPMKEARSLIDASEKPLRRSPPGMPHTQEEWPALSPQKLNTSNKPLATSRQQKLPALSIPVERYHKYDTTSPPASLDSRKGGIKLPPTQAIRRKQIGSSKSRDQLEPSSKPAKTVSYMQQTKSGKQIGMAPTPGSVEPSGPTAILDLSSDATALEKPAFETPDHPRQTRTSSLRARLSAGQLVHDHSGAKTRVVGFTDFTSVHESSRNLSKDSLLVPEETRPQPQSQPGTSLLRAKSSNGSMRANRAPAQFVGGSRRPNTHRPSSRSGLRNDARASCPYPMLQPPQEPALAVPISNEVSERGKVEAEASKTTESRRSSIPVFRHTISSTIAHADKRIASANTRQEHESLRSGFDMVEDQAKEQQPIDHNKEAIDKSTDVLHELTTSDTNTIFPSTLQVIEESPRQGYHVKRLSVASPENGPILKIFPDAERLIMGADTDKENGSKTGVLKGQDINDSFRKSHLGRNTSGTESITDSKKRLERPYSSQGLPQSASRFGLISKESREKKTRSAELSYSFSTDRSNQQSAKPKIPLFRKSTDICVADDPFFDAHSTLQQDQTTMTNPAAIYSQPTNIEEIVTTGEASWITPFVDKDDALSKGKAAHAVDSASPTLQRGLSSGSNTNRKCSLAANLTENAAGPKQMPSKGKAKSKNNAEKPLPSTPEQSRESSNSNSSSFPPRSSSHNTPPDYTIRGSTKLSLTSPSEGGIPTSEEFVHRHNRLGASKGHASYPVDVSHVAVFKRDSTARDSSRSQSSISKGMLSNIRGLFHKRSENESSSARSSKKYKLATSISTGSPFLPISEIHPVHRPTLASSNCCVDRGQKPTVLDTNFITPSTPSFASPLPSEICATTTLAMQLLDSVRTERSSPKKERALELGSIMVEAITQARDAQKALEEAKQAARRAEVAYALCKKAVGDVSRRVLEWRDEFSSN
ncbi:hypothetical protein MMC07_001022 [Pseudocyphellaria aurata]|nr:hypothetical protein [Pseudocyphellaria aurata]